MSFKYSAKADNFAAVHTIEYDGEWTVNLTFFLTEPDKNAILVSISYLFGGI